jgi:hypothetical protein
MKLKAATQEEAHRLTAQWNFQEAQGQAFHDLNKSGHKVSSMLLDYLKSNCPGQNKNCMMLQLTYALVLTPKTVIPFTCLSSKRTFIFTT